LRVFPTGSGKFAGDFPDGFSPGKSNAIAEEDGKKSERSQNTQNSPGREILVAADLRMCLLKPNSQ